MTARARITVRDLLGEIAVTVAARPGRALAAGFSVFLAAATYVATSGLSATLSQQVTDRFDSARATEVYAFYTRPPIDAGGRCPAQSLDETGRLAGTVSAGRFDTVRSAIVAGGTDPATTVDLAVVGATSGALAGIAPRIAAGRAFDDGAVGRADPVALLPIHAAARLGVSAPGQSIEIAGRRLLVIGIFSDVARRPETLQSAVVPATTLARLDTGPLDDGQHTCGVLVSTRAGAAVQVAAQLPFAVRPDQPSALTVIAPPDPATFRRTVERPVRLLALAVSLAALLLGAASIASTMSSSIAARVGEIGLRKALGARGIDIALHVTGEALLIGLVGGALGAIGGSYVVIGVALTHEWQPIVSLAAVSIVCAAGAVLGGLAGLIPGIRAARMPASESLRR